jgi:hypothetical protein
VPESEISPRDLRISDAEREHTITLLQRATGRGLIDVHEFTERSGRVITAKTRADLNRLLIDLPGLQLSGEPYEGPPSAPAPEDPSDVLELRGYGSRRFSGNWSVPSRIVITGAGASTRLDFTQARLRSRTVTIEFRSNLGGSASFLVPAGTLVRSDRLDLRGSQLSNRLPTTNPHPTLVLDLVGVKRYGTISIRGPRKTLRQTIEDLVR